jgi:hypothetical protein
MSAETGQLACPRSHSRPGVPASPAVGPPGSPTCLPRRRQQISGPERQSPRSGEAVSPRGVPSSARARIRHTLSTSRSSAACRQPSCGSYASPPSTARSNAIVSNEPGQSRRADCGGSPARHRPLGPVSCGQTRRPGRSDRRPDQREPAGGRSRGSPTETMPVATAAVAPNRRSASGCDRGAGSRSCRGTRTRSSSPRWRG